MKLQKVNIDKSLELINVYQHKQLAELQLIQPKWAIGKNANKAFSYFKQQLKEGYRIFLVEPDELIRNSLLNEVSTNSLFTGEHQNDYRISKILDNWKNNIHLDPPTVGISNHDISKLSFSDGRHRAKLSYFLELEKIPIAIDKSDFQRIKEIINLSSP